MITILIDNGEVFEGTPEQFQDCFFSNEFDEVLINEWAAEQGFKCEIIHRTDTVKRDETFFPLVDVLQELIKRKHLAVDFISTHAINEIEKEINKIK
jgi:hypothetical protein